MLKIRLAGFFFFWFIVAKAQQNYWQQQVDYNIAVTLDDKAHTLEGFIKMQYHNHSPDTLQFIWIHLWPNAYKNDRTAYTDQTLENGNTDFYFSNFTERGYINRLDFRVNGSTVKIADHPEHQEIIKIILSTPLAPGAMCKIETPFHLKLPYNFSRGGHNEQAYQLTQWYPKPAVYDSKGWHTMPYLDQGEFYAEFGNYEVQITLPANYVIAATGELKSEKREPISENIVEQKPTEKLAPKYKPFFPKKIIIRENNIVSSNILKTITYAQNNVHDFAWFADKRYQLEQDTLQLPSGRVIKVMAYSIKTLLAYPYWKNAIGYIKKAVLNRSNLLGEYPYNTITAVDGDIDYAGGMEYPTITVISGVNNTDNLEGLIEHEVGHQWFYSIVASNERDYPWMDEGMNTYYGSRYWNGEKDISVQKNYTAPFIKKKMPDNLSTFNMHNIIAAKKDQPIATTSDKLAVFNYDISAYQKASEWMKLVEQKLGTTMFDSCMKVYYNTWKYKHPYPQDFKNVVETVSGINIDSEFSLLDKKGKLTNTATVKRLKVAAFFSFKDTEKYKYIFLSPVVGYNMYDKVMVGLLIHNYTLPAQKFQFLATPMYATGSATVNGLARVAYHWMPSHSLAKIELAVGGSRFSTKQSLDTTLNKIGENFYKIVPSIRVYFKHSPRSTTKSWLDFRTYFIGEKSFANFDILPGVDSINVYPRSFVNTTRYINQLSFTVENSRELYPYQYQLQLQQGESFYRVNATGNYFFNYAKGGGFKARLFAAAFGYIGPDKSTAYLYQPKLLGGTGIDDYAYNSYFLGRSAAAFNPAGPVSNQGIAAQQIMVQNGGGLKFRFDKYDYLNGQSAKWIASINLSSSIPKTILPLPIPLSIFFDAGTYAEAWKKDASTTRFLYTGGLQLALFKNVLNIYIPLFYSKIFTNTLKTDPEQNKFFKKIFFSIELQHLKLKNFFPQFEY